MKPVFDWQLFGREGFARRLQMAIDAFEVRGVPSPSQKWIARKATSFLPQGETISATSISKCLSAKQLPESYARVWAIAKAVDADPGWLVFGGASEARPPIGVTARSEADAELGPDEMIEPKRREAPKPARRRKRG
jgi:hypothetical protein